MPRTLGVTAAERDTPLRSPVHDQPLQVYRRLAGYLTHSPGRLTLIALGLAVSTTSLLAVPWLIKGLSRDAVMLQQPHVSHRYLGLILGAATLLAAGRYLVEDQIGIVSFGMVGRLRAELTAKLFRLPLTHFVHGRGGEAVSTVLYDVRQLQTFLRDGVVTAVADFLVAAGSMALLFILSWKLALIMMVIAAVFVGVVRATSGAIRRRFTRMQEVLARMTSLLTERVVAMPAIHAFGAADHERQGLTARSDAYIRAGVLANRMRSASLALLGLLGAVAFVSLFALGTSELTAVAMAPTSASSLTFDRLLGFTLYALLTADPLRRLSQTNVVVQEALAAGRRVFALLDLPEERWRGRRVLPAYVRGRLQLESLSFAYRTEQPILTEIDLSIEPGEMIALVGPSGAGKSTLLHLLLGFHEPASGRILFGGHDLRELDVGDLRRRIGWVGHDPFLFDGSVADNIQYGAWGADRAAIEHAARQACADEFVRTLPFGYDTRIGERGVTLSAGQRVRLALARIVLRSPAVALLDEVTASLDTETEAELWTALGGWFAQRTVLVVAHRLATVLATPRVVVLEGGRKVGDGPADSLAQTCPTFTRIFREQLEAGAAH